MGGALNLIKDSILLRAHLLILKFAKFANFD